MPPPQVLSQLSPFNSLFEMPGSPAQQQVDRAGEAFNSLFEMHHDKATQHFVETHFTFNSLFEML